MYTLSLDTQCSVYLKPDTTWGKKSKSTPLRGMNDTEGGQKAVQKVNIIELILGLIANYCPVISRSTIIKNRTSVSIISQAIQMQYGFQSSRAHFIDFDDIHMTANERSEDLYQ